MKNIIPGNIYANSGPNYYPWNFCLLFYVFCWGIMHLPFAVADLYYAYRDTSCIYLKHDNIMVSFYVWFQADGYAIIGFFILFLFVATLGIPYPESECLYIFWQLFQMIFILWRIAWLVIGGVMFWGKINLTGACQFGISRYLWVVLIIGYTWALLSFFFAFGFIRPKSFAVLVPQPT